VPRKRHWGMHHDAGTPHGLDPPSQTWHLCWQAAVGREFFPHPSLHARIRERLIDAHRRPGRLLVDYCLLPTEIHVLSRLPVGSPPGEVARAIGNVVARWVREAQPVRSPVFAGPFRAHALHSVEDLLQQVRMLAWRPVALGLCGRPTHCAHGSLRIALGMTPAHGFDSRPILSLFGQTVSQARATLRRWVAPRPTDRDWRAWELTLGLTLAPGGVGPRMAVARAIRSPEAAALVAAAGTAGIDGALRLLSLWVAARVSGRCSLDLQQDSDGAAARARALVARIAIEHSLCSAASVARFFGRAKATLSEQMKSSRARQQDAVIVAMPVARIIEDVVALGAVVPPTSLSSAPRSQRARR
jgi:phosphoribosylcarboxyaminoimidazole (NCAIR) mutase